MEKRKIISEKKDGEGMTVEEIIEYQKRVKPIRQVYGKYGRMAKEYIEKYNKGKLMILAGELPEYLHGIDHRAEELYNTMYKQLSQKEEYRTTDDYKSNVKKIKMMQMIIEETILNEIVYEKN